MSGNTQVIFAYDELCNMVDRHDEMKRKIMAQLYVVFPRSREVKWLANGYPQSGYVITRGGTGDSPRVKCYNYKTKKRSLGLPVV